jgi:hypothetical protein
LLPSTSFTTTDDARANTVTLKTYETSTANSSDDRLVAEIADIIVYKTFRILFGGDNDTSGGSDNETGGAAYGSTPYAGGEVDWQTRIRTWFKTEFVGKLNFLLHIFCLG